MNWQATNNEGRFRFTTDWAGNPLDEGTYRIDAQADQYQPRSTDPFTVGVGEDRDLGDIPLTPFPIQFSEVRPCGDLPPEGGTCKYSVRARNGSTTPLQGAAWSLVEGSGIGSFINWTEFQTGKLGAKWPLPQKFALDPGERTVIEFRFTVPDTVATWAWICPRVFAGQSPNPLWETFGERWLFCISKGITGFTIVPEKEARQKLRQLRGKALGR